MEERIVIKEKTFKDFLLKHKDNHEICSFSPLVIMSRCRVEQVPETWEELKELCRKLKIGDCEVYITLQLTDKMKLYFYDNGEIIGAYLDFEYEFSLVKNRTPAQMWQIIKSLIGE